MPSPVPRERSLADEKWARIAAEYGDTCVWYRNGVGTCTEELPISRGLIDALDGWCSWYGKDCEEDLPPRVRDETPFDAVTHREVGLLLARAVKRQLPDWAIVFGWPYEQIEIPLGAPSPVPRDG